MCVGFVSAGNQQVCLLGSKRFGVVNSAYLLKGVYCETTK